VAGFFMRGRIGGMDDAKQLRNRIAQVDGGELTDTPGARTYSVIFPPAETRVVVYTTKPDALHQLIARSDDPVSVGMVGCYGLPHEDEVSGLAEICRGCTTYFLGDCDPLDLLVFLWVRHYLRVRFWGVSDTLISQFGVDVNDNITIPLADNEIRSMALLRAVWPDVAISIGPTCTALLRAGRKLEMEAIGSFCTRTMFDLPDVEINPDAST
jgi:hypothetical protein